MSETPRALEAYRVYERLGPQRSTEKVARELAKSVPLIKRWSAAHGWVARAAQYDARQAAQEAAAEEAERKRARTQRLQVARAVRGKGAEGLAALTGADLARLPSAIVRLFDYADTTERRDLGEPDHKVEVSGPAGGALTIRVVYDDGDLSDAGAQA